MKEHINLLRNKVKYETNLLNVKCNSVAKINGVIALGIANYVAFKVLDVPSDKGLPARHYYNNNLMSIVDEVVSGVNEACPIDYKHAVSLVWGIWYSRYLFVHGDVSEKRILDFLEDSPTLSSNDQDLCECREDLLC